MNPHHTFGFIPEKPRFGHRLEPNLLERERDEVWSHLWTARKALDHPNIDDPFVHKVLIEHPIEQAHAVILRACASLGVRFVNTYKYDFVCFGNVQTYGCPIAWTIGDSLGICIGTANGPQCQIFGFLELAPDTYGIWDTKTGEKIAKGFSLRDMRSDFINQPIPDGEQPDLRWLEPLDFRY